MHAHGRRRVLAAGEGGVWSVQWSAGGGGWERAEPEVEGCGVAAG